LVLSETALAVHIVPVADGIEWVEEGLRVRDPYMWPRPVLVIVKPVEHLHHPALQQPARENRWQRRGVSKARCMYRRLAGLGPAPLHQNASPEPRAASQKVGPTDGHRPHRPGRLQGIEKTVEVREALALLPNPLRGD